MGYNEYIIYSDNGSIKNLEDEIKKGYNDILFSYYNVIEFVRDYYEPNKAKPLFKRGQKAIHCGGERMRGKVIKNIFETTNILLPVQKYSYRDLFVADLDTYIYDLNGNGNTEDVYIKSTKFLSTKIDES